MTDTTNETQVEVTQACPNVLCNCDGYDIVFSPWAKAWHCKCLSCKAEGPVRPSRAEAITAWNTRIQAEKRNNALAVELREVTQADRAMKGKSAVVRFDLIDRILAALEEDE